ncbi:MAG: hypothetical protein HY551_07630 [Elusimicrobia bacterium]|nr:hypothetical protein [Elusimicrobiota bacterium]
MVRLARSLCRCLACMALAITALCAASASFSAAAAAQPARKAPPRVRAFSEPALNLRTDLYRSALPQRFFPLQPALALADPSRRGQGERSTAAPALADPSRRGQGEGLSPIAQSLRAISEQGQSERRTAALAVETASAKTAPLLRRVQALGEEISKLPGDSELLNAAFDFAIENSRSLSLNASSPEAARGLLAGPGRGDSMQVPPANAPPAPPGNQDPLRALYLKIDRDSPSHLTSLDRAQRRSLWNAAYRHSVAGLDDPRKLARYDPDGFIGFCFGRAMAVRLLARQMGLAAGSISELFIIGDLRSGPQPEWRFHVTTLVRGTDGLWQAIDTIFQGPMGVEAWIAAVQRGWDRQKLAKFYLVPASTVIPDVHQVPESPAQEKGERVIELSFDPARHSGFAAAPELGERVYSVSPEASAKHFKLADSELSAFDFAGITINGRPVSYNNYFADLLRSLAGSKEKALSVSLSEKLPRQPRRREKSRSLTDRPLGLRLERLLKP